MNRLSVGRNRLYVASFRALRTGTVIIIEYIIHNSVLNKSDVWLKDMEPPRWTMLQFPCFLLLFLNAAAIDVSNSTITNNTVTCERNHEYDDLDTRTVMGKWKVAELYLHLSKEGVKTFKSCPIMTIWETDDFPRSTYGPSTENQLFHVQHINAKFRQEYRHLRLLWDEAGETIEYALYFRNDSAGYWRVYSGQNGTIANRPSYQQFSGTVQVLKAVNDHLLLNFCQEGTNTAPALLYSVLFSRDPGTMPRWQVDSVHTLLQSKKLSVASRRMVCGNGAERPYTMMFSILTCLITYIISCS